MDYVPAAQFKAAWTAAYTSFEQSTFHGLKKKMEKDDLTPTQVVKTLPKLLQTTIGPKFRKSLAGGAKPQGGLTPTQSKAGAKAIRDRQTALDKAGDAVKRYTDYLYEHLGEPGCSTKIAAEVLQYHRTTYKQLGVRLEKGAAVVEKAIAAKHAELSRNPNRSI